MDGVKGVLDRFIVEPFVVHEAKEEVYVCFMSVREGDMVLFHHQGGVDVGDVDSKAKRMMVPIDQRPKAAEFEELVRAVEPPKKRHALCSFLELLFSFYASLNFAYLEINPLVVKEDSTTGEVAVIPLDMAAKLDECAKFECSKDWGNISFPPPFGRAQLVEELAVQGKNSVLFDLFRFADLSSRTRLENWRLVEIDGFESARSGLDHGGWRRCLCDLCRYHL